MIAVQLVVTTHGMTFDKRRRTLSCEHSTLGSPALGSLLRVRSHVTGAVLEFTREGLEWNRNETPAELVATRYYCHGADLSLVIWND